MSVLGCPHQAFVVKGNLIAETLSKVLQLLHELGVYYIIEQPASSLFYSHPDIAELLAAHGDAVTRVRFKMQVFGAKSPKPTLLVGTAPFLHVMLQEGGPPREFTRRPPPEVVRLARVSANGRVTGNRALLQESAAYPPLFCAYVAHSIGVVFQWRFQVLTLALRPLFRDVAKAEASLSSLLAELTLAFV